MHNGDPALLKALVPLVQHRLQHATDDEVAASTSAPGKKGKSKAAADGAQAGAEQAPQQSLLRLASSCNQALPNPNPQLNPNPNLTLTLPNPADRCGGRGQRDTRARSARTWWPPCATSHPSPTGPPTATCCSTPRLGLEGSNRVRVRLISG